MVYEIGVLNESSWRYEVLPETFTEDEIEQVCAEAMTDHGVDKVLVFQRVRVDASVEVKVKLRREPTAELVPVTSSPKMDGLEQPVLGEEPTESVPLLRRKNLPESPMDKPSELNDYMSTNEMAEFLGIAVSTANALRSRQPGQFPAITSSKFGKTRCYVSRAAVEAYKARRDARGRRSDDDKERHT